MGTAYKIKCKHCGTEFQHSASACYGLYQECVGCGSSVVETDIPIRCPSCLHVLNRTEQEFNEQVEVVMMWDCTFPKTSRKGPNPAPNAHFPKNFTIFDFVLDTPSRHNQADACFCARLSVSLTSS